ncbi:MAG: cupredoxin domain-containing protein [Thermomicrobiales bacterium]
MLAVATVVGGMAFSATAHEAGPHPVHVHTGTCNELGEVIAPLTSLEQPAGEATGPGSARQADRSETTVDLALSDILEGGHAINAHESEENPGNYIACGDVGGVVVNGTLVIGLGELNDSGFTGIAVLEENGDQTDVNVYLTRTADNEASGTPSASAEALDGDSDSEASGDEVAVEIVDFTFPETLEIAVGTTVTWTNQDSARHTVTSDPNGDAFQSGTMNEGDTFSFTFEEAGTFEYFCEFHANMQGTVIVS